MNHRKPNLWQRLIGAAALPGTGAAPQIAAALSNPVVPANMERDTRVVARFTLQPPDRQALRRLPVHCGIDIDRSGSMSGAKIARAAEASCALVSAMEPDDLITVVAFHASAEAVLTAAAPGPQAEHAIRAIRAGGGTNIGEALEEGYRRLQGDGYQQRLLLVSDGAPSCGDCDEAGLAQRAARAREQGIITSTLGIGDGYNARLMARIAEAGGGTHRFVDKPHELQAMFQAELGAAAFTAAADAELILQPSRGAAVVQAYPFTMHPQQDGAICVPVGNLDASQTVDVIVDLLAPPRPAGPARIARAWLNYRDPGSGQTVRSTPVDVVVEYNTDPVAVARAANPEVMRRRQICRAADQVKTVLDANLTVPERTRQLAEVQRTLAETGLAATALARTLTETISEMGHGVQGGAGQKTLVETAHTVTRGERMLS